MMRKVGKGGTDSRRRAVRLGVRGRRASLGLGWRLAWRGCARRGLGVHQRHLFGVEWLCYCGAGPRTVRAGVEEGGEGIVVRRHVRTCLAVPTAHYILYRLPRIQCLLVFHYAKRCEAPVDRVHAQVRRHVVGQVILILRCTLFSREDLVRLEDNSTTYFP